MHISALWIPVSSSIKCKRCTTAIWGQDNSSTSGTILYIAGHLTSLLSRYQMLLSPTSTIVIKPNRALLVCIIDPGWNGAWEATVLDGVWSKIAWFSLVSLIKTSFLFLFLFFWSPGYIVGPWVLTLHLMVDRHSFILLLFWNNYHFTLLKKPSSFEAHVIHHHHTLLLLVPTIGLHPGTLPHSPDLPLHPKPHLHPRRLLRP